MRCLNDANQTSLLDAALALGATMRLTRLLVNDDLGAWWVKDPAQAWADRNYPAGRDLKVKGDEVDPPWRSKLISGLDCPYCVGFWLGTAVLASRLSRSTRGAWRFVCGSLTLNEVAAHLGVLLGDFGE